jgi:DNA-binding transcriptional LysR family regulator
VIPLPPERSFPLRVPIRDGESLDSWVEATARRNMMSARRLLTAFGLHPRELPGHQFHAVVLGLPPSALRRMERQAGLPDGRLDAAVADRYTALGWEVLRGCRYCPRCLSEHNGRWQLRWRLPWVFACVRHRLLMPDRCPGCGQLPRQRLSQPTGLNPPGTCPNLIRRGQICGTDLTTTPYQSLPAGDRRLAAQRWLDHRLADSDNGDPAAVTDLVDLHAVVTWIRSRTTPRDFEPYGPTAVAAFTRYITQRVDGRRPEQHEFTDPLLVAAVVTHAVALVRADNPTAVLPVLTPLLGVAGHTPINKRGSAQPIRINVNRWRTLSPGLRQRLLHAADAALAPLDRLRLRTVTTNPRLPDATAAPASQQAVQRVRWVPQMLWPQWAVRLLPARGVHLDTLRAVASAALLVPGHPEWRLTTIAADLHASTATGTLRRLLQHGSGVLEVICRLTDHLDTHGAPIDYQRRRAAISTDLLDPDQWWQVCFDAHAHPGEVRRHLDAHRYVYQLLTGADLTGPAAGPLRLTTASDRNVYVSFTTTLTTPLRRRLHQHAATHLRDLDLREPLTWAPPGHLADGLRLPGRDPDDIDMETVRSMIIEQQQTFQAVAQTLGTTIDHVRLAAEHIHRPARQWARNAAPTYWRTQQRAQRLLTAEFFQREYVHAGKTLTQIAEQTGLHRTMLAEYAHAAGIRLVNATERDPTPIDPQWLRHQYGTLGRSFTDIGTELGLSEMTVNRAARRFDIPIRPAGVTSHPQIIARLDHRFPLDIRRAVEGVRHGWLRLHRFQQAMAHPSLNTAAGHLDIHPSALINQIHRLEADIGAPLFHRTTPAQPMRPTNRGAALLDALTKPNVQALLHQHAKPLPGWKPNDRRRVAAAARPAKIQNASRLPDRPQQAQQPTAQPIQAGRRLPDILRAATQHSRGGWARLHRFATVMSYPTLTEAADALGINISTLIGQLNRLEHDVGEPLFNRATPDGHTQRPTRRGAVLLRALARADTQPADRTDPTTTTETVATTTTTLNGLPRDLLRAVRGQQSGWTRLERFADTMTHPTITDAAAALGIERTTLLEQLHRLETHVGANLYHRATAQGQAHRPTPRGAKLLNILAQPDVQDLRAARARLPRVS